MKISEIKECIDRMKTLYIFEDEDTELQITKDIRSCKENTVEIYTHDDSLNIDVHLSTTPPIEPFK